MVEITPYVSDDEGEENWVPLSSPAAPRAAPSQVARGESAKPKNSSLSPEEDADDGEDWETLPPHRHAASTGHDGADDLESAVRAAVAGEAAGYVGRRLLSLLTSTPTTTRGGTAGGEARDGSTAGGVSSNDGTAARRKPPDDGSEGSDDEGVNWSRPNALGEDRAMEFDRRKQRRKVQSAVEEEYGDFRTNRDRSPIATVGAFVAEELGRRASEEARRGVRGQAGRDESGAGGAGSGGDDEASKLPRPPDGEPGQVEPEEGAIGDRKKADVDPDRAEPAEPSPGARPEKVEDDGTNPSEDSNAQKFAMDDDEDDEVPESRFVRVAPASGPERQSHRQQQQRRADAQTPEATIKSRLRRRLVYAPLRSLPGTFLRHLYFEVAEEFGSVWERLRHEDFGGVAAPLALSTLLLLVAAALVSKGVCSLVFLGMTNALQFALGSAAWCVRFYATAARYTLWTTLFACGVSFMVQRLAAREGLSVMDWAKTRVPEARALLPWAMAATSLSFHEVLAMWLSTGVILRTIALPWTGSEVCVEDQVCTDRGSSALGAVVALVSATFIAFLNLIAVRIWAARVEGAKGEGDGDSRKPSTSSFYFLVNRIVPGHLSSELEGACSDVTRNIASCHACSVVCVAAAAAALALSRVLYDGRSGLASVLGAIGASVAFIALGGYLAVRGWKIAASAVSDGCDIQSVTLEELSRRALAAAVADVTSTLWTEEGGLLGALSGDDDEALKLAVLRWVVDNLKSRGRTDADTGEASSEDVPQGSTDVEDDENTRRERTTSPSRPSSRSEPRDRPSGPTGFDSGWFREGPEAAACARSDSSRPSYRSLQDLIAKLDADDTLIPTIQRYRAWVYSLPPSKNVAMYLAVWKMCPATFLTGAVATRLLLGVVCSVLQLLYSGVHFTGASGFWIRLILTTATAVTLSPTVIIEYERVRIWWANASIELGGVEVDPEHPSMADAYKSAIILRADWVTERPGPIPSFVIDSTASFQRVWALLLDSIAALERSVPAVRCATVASATANLTSDSITLVDLAVEVNKRGLLGGIGLMVWDAFQFHLSRELENRSGGTDRGLPDDCGGKYTSAVVGAVQNVGKIGHNIKQIRISKQPSQNEHADTSETCDPCDGRSTPAPPEDEASQSEGSESASNDDNPECTGTNPTREGGRPKDTPEVNSVGEDDETPETKSEVSNEAETEGNHLLPLIGGGLALLGTAVATLAISASQTGQKDRDREKKNKEE